MTDGTESKADNEKKNKVGVYICYCGGNISDHVDPEKCIGTGACVEACISDGALRLVDMEISSRTVKRAQVSPALCLGCGACVSGRWVA